MASAFINLDELIADLQNLPKHMEGEAIKHIITEANGMAIDVRQRYGFKTGTLVKRVVVEVTKPLLVKVRSKAPHAWLYEYGSVKGERFWKTGSRKSTGTMPPKPTFIPAKYRALRRLTREFDGMVRRIKIRGMTGSAA